MNVLSFPDARHMVEAHARQLRAAETERVNLLDAGGRVLAQEVKADRDQPPFRRAARDGFAVRVEDVAQVPARLKLVAEIAAGTDVSGIRIGRGECASIMTGAAAPDGANAVVMVEYTATEKNSVEIQRGVGSGDNIVPRGVEARAEQVLLAPGTRLAAAAIAVAASVGLAEVQVFRRSRVAILATGDELVDIASTPAAHQIRNSNSYSLALQVMNAGGIPVVLPIAPDEEGELRRLIEEGLSYDLLLLSGGVSMGKYDLVEKVLSGLGAELLFTGVEIQPGKPVVFGKVLWHGETKYFFGLPGNPVSTMVTFELFARVVIEGLSGAGVSRLRFGSARLKAEIKVRPGLTRFLPASLSGEFGDVEVELVRWQGSGDMVATATANCLAVILPEREKIAAGETIFVMKI